jgi:hypothetical protein
MINLEQVKRHDGAEDATRMANQFLARLGELELPLVVPHNL